MSDQRRYTGTQIDRIAEKVRSEYNGEEEKTNVVKIANALGFDVYEATFDNDRIAGKVEDDGENRVIYVNRNDIAPRKRFTVAHEIGHIVLHHPLDNQPFVKVDNRGANDSFDRKEFEANRFAASLLMPKEESVRVWEETRDVDDFADRMGVSKAAAAIRLESLGLI